MNAYYNPVGSNNLLELRVKFESELHENNLTVEEQQSLIMQHGTQSSSYFTLQEDVDHFGIPGVGFITYFTQRSVFSSANIVFSRPVCADEDLHYLLGTYFRKVNRKTMFMGIDEATALALVDYGYYMNELGTEFQIPIQNYALVGKDMKHLRWASNLGKRGFVVREQLWEEVDQQRVDEISRVWKTGKVIKNSELRLLTRPPEFRNAWKVRKFYCYKDGELIGYVFFDPYYKNGKVIGYTANILRGLPGVKPNGYLDYVVLEAMKIFREEGVEWLSLGLSPLYDIQSSHYDNFIMRKILEFIYDHCGFIYSFQSLSYHKTRYRGVGTKWYICNKDINPVTLALISAIAMQVI